MKQTKIKIASVVGNSTEKRWSQVYSDLSVPSRAVFMAIDLRGAELMDLPMYGAEVLEGVSSKYGGGGLEELRGAVEEVSLSLEAGLEMSIAVVSIVEGVVYVVGNGEVGVALYREGEVYPIFEGEEDLSSVSGELNEGDSLVLATNDFFRTTKDELSEAVMGDAPGDEILAPILHNQKDSSGMAGMIIDYNEEEEMDKGSKAVVGDDVKEKEKDSVFEKIGKIRGRMRGGVRVKRERDGKKSTVLGVVVLVLLIVSVVIGAWRRSKLTKERNYNQLEQRVEQQMDEVRSIADLNPERARYLLTQSRQEVDMYLSEIEDESYKSKGEDLKSLINETEEKALRKSEVSVEPYIDLNVVKEGARFSGFKLDEDGNVYMYDQGGGGVYAVNIEDKSSFLVGSGEDYSGVRDLSYYDARVFGVVSEGVVAKSADGDRELVIEADEVWEDVRFIEMYAGNVYVLDKGTGEIWKYPVLDDGWGARRRWFGTGIVLDLSNIVDFGVDGDIWLLSSSGNLERYSRGVPVDFSLEGFGERFSQPRGVFVDDEFVYVLEAGEKRVVVFNKEGVYERQYVGEEFGIANNLVVYEGSGYVFSEDKVYKFEVN